MTAPTAARRKPSPPALPGLVPRERLVQRLLATGTVPVVLAVAPAGYGKTTILSQWDARDKRDFAWISLSDSHNDARRLRREIGRTLDSLGQGFVLVLDDLHLLTEPDALDVLETIAGQIPDGSQLALASRQEPQLPLGRMRAKRQIHELGVRDFALTRGEAAAILRSVGLQLDAADVAALVKSTEGWPAALYLAALSLLEQPHGERTVADFGGDDRFVADYLRDEFLAHVAPDVVAFLMRTSVLDTLSAGACDAVLRRRGSGRVLKDLARKSLLIPLDRTDERYRCHSLFADMLKAELRRREPENEPELHRRASAWYADSGEIGPAIEHAVAARDADRAGELMWSQAASYIFQGRNATVRGWLDRFTADQIASNPLLALTAAASDLVAGRSDWVERWTAAAARAGGPTVTTEAAAEVAVGVALMRGALARGGIASFEAGAARAHAAQPNPSTWRSLCCFLSGAAGYLLGDRERAAEQLEDGARQAAVEAPGVRALCCAQLALLAIDEGDWAQAGALGGRARAQAAHGELADYPIMALVFAVSALVRAQRGRVVEAQEDMKHALRLLARLEDFAPWYELETRVTLARAAVRLSDVAEARRLLTRTSRVLRRTDAPALAERVQAAWAEADQFIAASVVAPTTLTTAELRVLRLLPTHLSFREMGSHLHVSANTIKSQAHAVYRKLDASSRSDAVDHARAVGLLDGQP